MKAGERLSPAIVLPFSLSISSTERRKSVIIIQNNPQSIKQWNENIQRVFHEYSNQPFAVQNYIQKEYTRMCLSHERRLLEVSQARMIPRSSAFSLISSSKKRSFAINESEEIVLYLYQIRAKNHSHHENILVEPFYPGIQIDASGNL